MNAAEQEALLDEGSISIVGRVAESSNATFVVEVTRGDDYTWAIYKPEAGERPLWDFEPGLYKRERAAYLLDAALGWGLVPPTAIRLGPYGQGAVQLFIAADFSQHYFTFRDEPALQPSLQRIGNIPTITQYYSASGAAQESV